jgi:hypothetical protein
VTHSHMPIQHLLKQVEAYGAKRASRDVRPPWLTDFIDEIADLFEPISGAGRVGFDCQLAEDCWVAGLYLGSTEFVGGRDDGRLEFTNFELDLRKLTGYFTTIEEFYLGAFPSPTSEESRRAHSYITIGGLIDENPIRLQVFSVPPEHTGPGLRRLPNGSDETV